MTKRPSKRRASAARFPFVQAIPHPRGHKTYYYFRRGHLSIALPGEPGEPGFIGAYKRALKATSKPPRPQGQVYFLKMGDFVKIGFSTDWRKRIRNLSNACPLPVETLLLLKGGTVELERALHHRFKQLRTQREWFRFEQPIADFVEAEKIAHASFTTQRKNSGIST